MHPNFRGILRTLFFLLFAGKDDAPPPPGERPKYQVKDDTESPRNGLQAYGEASGTVKIVFELVRTVVKPPLIRERREENLQNESSPRRSSDNENQLLSAASNGLYESSEVSLGRYRRDLSDEKESSFPECASSTYTSCEDTSTSGTIVFCGQHDDSGSPQTPRSRLGFLEKTSNSCLEGTVQRTLQ
ncbi:hypothetical protein Dimus_015747, partial [Dionaea muscipula]